VGGEDVTSPFDTTVVGGEVRSAEPFPEARTPELFKLEIDLGDRVVQSAAQLGYHHAPEELVGRQVLCAVGLGVVNIAGFDSEALTVGVPGDDGKPVLVTPDETVPPGGELY
jgi:tRNA-binding protein